MTSIELDRGDATELAELLTLLSDWLSGPDRAVISQSLRRFIGIDAYDLPDLHDDLARFTFLLGHNDGEQLFGSDQP
jgi:hypothetical protein